METQSSLVPLAYESAPNTYIVGTKEDTGAPALGTKGNFGTILLGTLGNVGTQGGTQTTSYPTGYETGTTTTAESTGTVYACFVAFSAVGAAA
jgi:hypothetical protein